jgi:uncharacterized repeat protein (TIGR01451 family)
MFTFHRFRCVLFVLLVGFTAVTLFPTGSRAQTQPVTVTITQLEQLGDDFDPTSLGDFFAHVTINGVTHSTFDDQFSFDGGFVVPSGPLIPNPPWVLTEDVPLGLATVLVRIEIFDDDLLTGNEKADLNPGPKEVIDLEVDLTTGRWSGDVEWPQNCIAGPIDPDFDNKSVEVCFDLSLGDEDGDGLLDSWEQSGFDANDDGTIDVNLPALGANPLRKDVFVEVDCLVAGTHSHCPRQDAIDDIVRSFANASVANPDGTTGVQLHVDIGPLFGAGTIVPVPGAGGVIGTYGNLGGGGSQIPETGNTIIDFDGAIGRPATNFYDLKRANFAPVRAAIFRYAIFAHQTNARRPINDCTSGSAELHGNDFFVTLGGVADIGFPCATVDANGFSVGSRGEQAGTFMHELGHTLNLQHGGDQALTNDKPNYLSVMNYAFQFCTVTPSPNGVLPGGCDYSRIALPPALPPAKASLLELGQLDECIGIDRGQLGFGARKWDADDVLEGATCPPPNTANVRADINGDGFFTLLTGFDDWSSLRYNFRTSSMNFPNGAGVYAEDEADPDTIREAREFMAAMAAPRVVVDKAGPATARPGDVLTYTTQISNQGRGPALEAVLTDTRPDGGTQVEEMGAIVVGGSATRTSNFTVPLNACPGDFTGASASLAFKDFVSNFLTVTGSAPLRILDEVQPTLTVTVSPTTLWPPNHKFQEITATITATDNCDPNPRITLVSVTSNEPETGFLGNGDKGPDIQGAALGTDDRAFSLRSERGTGGQNTGRVYTITYRATDASGNTKDMTATVTVPTSNSGN